MVPWICWLRLCPLLDRSSPGLSSMPLWRLHSDAPHLPLIRAIVLVWLFPWNKIAGHVADPSSWDEVLWHAVGMGRTSSFWDWGFWMYGVWPKSRICFLVTPSHLHTRERAEVRGIVHEWYGFPAPDPGFELECSLTLVAMACWTRNLPEHVRKYCLLHPWPQSGRLREGKWEWGPPQTSLYTCVLFLRILTDVYFPVSRRQRFVRPRTPWRFLKSPS